MSGSEIRIVFAYSPNECYIRKKAILSTFSYHIREGDHNVLTYDWERYLDFADYHFNTVYSNKIIHF